jgi:hypothetical protein
MQLPGPRPPTPPPMSPGVGPNGHFPGPMGLPGGPPPPGNFGGFQGGMPGRPPFPGRGPGNMRPTMMGPSRGFGPDLSAGPMFRGGQPGPPFNLGMNFPPF